MLRKLILLLCLLSCSFSYSQNITGAEYFLDTDPGVGNGTAIAGPYSGNPINKTFNLTVASITPGVHRVVVRSKNASNVWSLQLAQLFAVVGSGSGNPVFSSGQIQAAEYFFDNDPGVGLGTAIPGITTGNIVNKTNFVIPISSLTPGVHRVVVRAKDTNGIWSHQLAQLFAVVGTGSANPITPSGSIVAAEYFFNTDPGQGLATPLTITPGDNVDYLGNINISGLSQQDNFLVVRTKDSNGIWSLQIAEAFSTCTPSRM